jgi:hypothetical protein
MAEGGTQPRGSHFSSKRFSEEVPYLPPVAPHESARSPPDLFCSDDLSQLSQAPVPLTTLIAKDPLDINKSSTTPINTHKLDSSSFTGQPID